MTAPVRWSNDGKCFRTNPWTRLINLGEFLVDASGNPTTTPMDWSNVTFTVETVDLPDGVTPTLSVDLAARTVTLSMDETTTASLVAKSRFQWFLRAQPSYGDVLWRREIVCDETWPPSAAAGTDTATIAVGTPDVVTITVGDAVGPAGPQGPQGPAGSGGGGSSLPADAEGWLHDDGTGALAWSTPTAADVGAATPADVTAETTRAEAAEAALAGQVTKAAVVGTGLAPADIGADTPTARDAAITTAVNDLVDGAPAALDTLNEIATQLGSDESAVSALTATVAGKQPLDADLTTIAALDSSQAGAIASDGAGWVRKSVAQFRSWLGLAAVAISGAYSDLTGTPTLGTAAAQNKVAAGSTGVLDATDPTTTNSRNPNTTVGLLASMPATGTGSKAFYFATDDAGGTLYQDQTNGAAYTRLGRRGELWQAKTTAQANLTLAANTWTDIDAALNGTVAADNRPVYADLYIPHLYSSVASDLLAIAVYDVTAATFVGFTQFRADATATNVSFVPLLRARIAPGTASHTYKAQIKSNLGSQVHVGFIGGSFPCLLTFDEK